MNAKSFLIVMLVMVCSAWAEPGDLKMEARLLWGTNEEKSSDPKHRKVEGELVKKLENLPFKWKNFFEVSKHEFTATTTAPVKVEISEKCFIEVRNEGDSRVSVVVYGKGKPVNKITKSLPKGEVLAIGGNDKRNCSWFIVVNQVEEAQPQPRP